MIGMFQGKNFQQAIETQTLFEDRQVLPHLSKILQLINSEDIKPSQLIELSNIAKQSEVKVNPSLNIQRRGHIIRAIEYPTVQTHQIIKKQFEVKNFLQEAQKLAWAGISLGNNVNLEIQKQLLILAQKQSLKESRFWGKILGSQKDYYVIQALKAIPKTHINIPIGSEKIGQGVNYYSFFVTNDIFQPVWVQLPYIKIEHIKVARKIKKLFTGNLDAYINSFPIFQGSQAHYLKAQLVRLTSALQLTPKGIYKPNDDNPKLIEYEQQVKIPQSSQLATLEAWTHKNLMILNLGRCTHFVDPSLPEDQIEAVTAELAQKDPQIQRLRAITEDKPAQAAQGQPPAMQNYWILKTVGNDQVFPKQDIQNIYAITTLRNILWPGWITIGYKNGYSNFYLGNGLKSSQPSWSYFTNQDLKKEQEQLSQFPQPNPKELPPPPVQGNADKNQGQEGQQQG